MSIARRDLLRGRLQPHPQSARPPGALEERAFLDRCTRCDACRTACPTEIVTRGSGGYPELDFDRGECTFCGACVAACEPGALTGAAALRHKAVIGDGCLVRHGVVCRACGEACEPRAIRFTLEPGRRAMPQLDLAACNGCGACVRACTGSAIGIRVPSSSYAIEVQS